MLGRVKRWLPPWPPACRLSEDRRALPAILGAGAPARHSPKEPPRQQQLRKDLRPENSVHRKTPGQPPHASPSETQKAGRDTGTCTDQKAASSGEVVWCPTHTGTSENLSSFLLTRLGGSKGWPRGWNPSHLLARRPGLSTWPAWCSPGFVGICGASRWMDNSRSFPLSSLSLLLSVCHSVLQINKSL